MDDSGVDRKSDLTDPERDALVRALRMLNKNRESIPDMREPGPGMIIPIPRPTPASPRRGYNPPELPKDKEGFKWG